MAKPKVKWLHEEVLQRYIKDSVNLDGNPEDWEINGKKVTHVEYNQTFDAYPDLVFSVEDGETYPVEVEWTSKDFNHKIDVLTEGNGCVFLLVKNIPNIGVPQHVMKLAGFKKWVKKNSDHLVQDTFDILKKTWQKDIQRLWIFYISGRGGGVIDYPSTLPKQIWGVPEKAKNIGKFKQIKKNDLAMFLIKGTGFPGRSPKNLWQTRHFKGKFNQLQVFRITSDYFQIKTLKEIATEKYGEAAADGLRPYKGEKVGKIFLAPNLSSKRKKAVEKKFKDGLIWPIRNGEIYPHRFTFDDLNSKGKKPLINLRDIEVQKMILGAEREHLRKSTINTFDEGDSSTLVQCIHCGKQVT